jgi:hypothetical protein
MARQRNYDYGVFCSHCGEHFHASRYDAQYCSASCRSAAARVRKQAPQALERAKTAISDYLGHFMLSEHYEAARLDLMKFLAFNSLVPDDQA